jgi:hypothetical protein
MKHRFSRSNLSNQPVPPFLDAPRIAEYLGSHRSGMLELDRDGHCAMVQRNSAILVLSFDEARRIYSPTPVTGAIPMDRAL